MRRSTFARESESHPVSAPVPWCVQTTSVLALTEVRKEDAAKLEQIVSNARLQFNDNAAERRRWGGGVMGSKAQAVSDTTQRAIQHATTARCESSWECDMLTRCCCCVCVVACCLYLGHQEARARCCPRGGWQGVNASLTVFNACADAGNERCHAPGGEQRNEHANARQQPLFLQSMLVLWPWQAHKMKKNNKND